MPSFFLFLGGISAFSGVVLGAFGAHGLKSIISPEALMVYQTAVTYQMWHALGLIGIALMRQHAQDSNLLRWAGLFMFLGIVLFSGSLYLLAIFDLTALGKVTPIGGVSFLVAWSLIIIFSGKKTQRQRYKSSRY